MAAKKAESNGPGKPGPAGVSFYVSPEEYAKTARAQKKWVRALADDIEAGKPIEGKIDRQAVAGILRLWADNLEEIPRGKRGPAPKFCHGSEALSYAMHRWKGLTHGQALAEIADRVGVSETAVNKAIEKHRAGAFAVFGFPDPGN